MINTIKTDLAKATNETSTKSNPRFDLRYFPQSAGVANALNQMFPEQAHEDKTVQKAKEILGDKFTTDEVKSMITAFEYLASIWLEEYEKKVFNKTLKEVLQSIK
ncbi:MAG TPA: hypothetical protein VLF89_09190 [Candidatus Saccharimonadales bacterium]|nr:hypothetical protein [Candidatus Saccharimonadales bacterium]